MIAIYVMAFLNPLLSQSNGKVTLGCNILMVIAENDPSFDEYSCLMDAVRDSLSDQPFMNAKGFYSMSIESAHEGARIGIPFYNGEDIYQIMMPPFTRFTDSLPVMYLMYTIESTTQTLKRHLAKETLAALDSTATYTFHLIFEAHACDLGSLLAHKQDPRKFFHDTIGVRFTRPPTTETMLEQMMWQLEIVDLR